MCDQKVSQEDLDKNQLQEETALILENGKPSEEKLKTLLEDQRSKARQGLLEPKKNISPHLGG